MGENYKRASGNKVGYRNRQNTWYGRIHSRRKTRRDTVITVDEFAGDKTEVKEREIRETLALRQVKQEER